MTEKSGRKARARDRRWRCRTASLGVVALMGATLVVPALAGGGHFIGGMVAGHVLTGAAQRSERQTQAAEYQAYHNSGAAYQTSGGSSGGGGGDSAEKRLDSLDKLAAAGYITKDEYKRRRQAIIDSM